MRYLILIISLLLHPVILAQGDIGAIKTNPDYYWAEGHGITTTDADNDAMGQISSQLSATITERVNFQSKTTRNQSQGLSSSDHYTDLEISRVSTSVTSCLQNVERLVLKDEPNAIVFRYVLKSDVDKMFDEREKKIKDLILSGQKSEKQLLIDDALRDYYWALMLSKALPTPIYAEFDGETESKNCLTYLPSKIKSVLSNINAAFEESYSDDNRIFAKLRFKYSQHDISSVQIHYFDGQSYIGPLAVKDGLAQLELIKLPTDKLLNIRYEYAFRDEAESLDNELKAVFEAFKPEITNASIAIPIKVDNKKQEIVADKKAKNGVSIEMETSEKEQIATIPAPEIISKERIPLARPEITDGYINILNDIEKAISSNNAENVFSYFEPAAFAVLDTLLNHIGKVRLIGKTQHYDFIDNGHQVIARFCKISIRYNSGKTFTENLTFRFNKHSGKIESLAFALTKKAEDDIFWASSSWPEISRFAIMQFMEDYQTAYALRRIGYINQIFSNDAIIISGAVAKKATPADLEGRATITSPYVNYKKENKNQFIKRINNHFNTREYIHLKFEDNRSQGINHPKIGKGKAFAIEIKQHYRSSAYSDKGYLTLLLDATKSPMLIHMRLWQPKKADIDLGTFVENINFDKAITNSDNIISK